VPPFHLDCTEVTIAAYRKFRTSYRFPEGQVMPPEDHAAVLLSWDDAVGYAEWAGKRLPDEAEYEFAATSGGGRRFPWGDNADLIREWKFGPAGTPEFDRVEFPGQPPVFGLYSNVAEWTGSWFSLYPGAKEIDAFRTKDRVVRGGDYSVIKGEPAAAGASAGPRQRILIPGPVRTHPGLGFRCARSPRPRLNPEDFGAILAD
jgi:formylglycine-generating enzyme required for sulfatase activity